MKICCVDYVRDVIELKWDAYRVTRESHIEHLWTKTWIWGFCYASHVIFDEIKLYINFWTLRVFHISRLFSLFSKNENRLIKSPVCLYVPNNNLLTA
jgi:hypothetical protein